MKRRNEEEQMRLAIHQLRPIRDPDDQTRFRSQASHWKDWCDAVLIFADWLEERGRPEAELLRSAPRRWRRHAGMRWP